MEDLDLIARVYAVAHHTQSATEAIMNSIHYVSPVEAPPPDETEYNSREPTPTPDPRKSDKTPPPEDPFLELRFSKVPRSSHGFLFGRHPNCDVVLPNRTGFSHYQCSITFDAEGRLIVKDLQSTLGTIVKYNDKANSRRSGFRWIISGCKTALHDKVIVIEIDDTVCFRIVVPQHSIESPVYVSKVDRWCAGQQTTQDLFQAIDLRIRPDTQCPTGAHTPCTDPIFLSEEVGKGGHGVVTYQWNVSDGFEFVVKEPLRPRHFNKEAWKNEARIMNLISGRSPYIVTFFGANFEPFPRIALEYLPGGSLEDKSGFSTKERGMILSQCLEGLSFLHEHNPVIVHRDIKPGNILIKSRDEHGIQVKLGDFGLSKDHDIMSTMCGTHGYLAPEVYKNNQYSKTGGLEERSYTAAVDIWSLGVVLCGLEWPLPEWDRKYEGLGMYWGELVRETFLGALDQKFDALGEFVLNKMLSVQPNLRPGAGQCLEEVSLVIQNDTAALPFTGSGSSKQTTSRHASCGGLLTVVPGQTLLDTDWTPSTALERAAGNPGRTPNAHPQRAARRRVDRVSHISIRDLFFDKAGLVRMIVNRQEVSMRMPGFQISASELFRVVQLDKTYRDNFVRKLKQRQAIEWEASKRQSWVNFREGVFLCQALGIEGELYPLLSLPGLDFPPRERNYLLNDTDGFKVLQWNGNDIPYKPGERIVGITALSKLVNGARNRVRQFLRARPEIKRTTVRRGAVIFYGTYVSYEDAMTVCSRFNLDAAPVEHLMNSPSPEQVPSGAVPSLAGPVRKVALLEDAQPGGLTRDEVRSALASLPRLAQDQDTATKQCSFFTEASYSNGSYLAPACQSHLQLRDPVRSVEDLGEAAEASANYDIGGYDSDSGFAEFLNKH